MGDGEFLIFGPKILAGEIRVEENGAAEALLLELSITRHQKHEAEDVERLPMLLRDRLQSIEQFSGPAIGWCGFDEPGCGEKHHIMTPKRRHFLRPNVARQ